MEFLAGVDKEKVVQAHGGFTSAHCIECNTEIDTEYIKATVFNDEVPSCHECDGLVKPDIVFFGENLPARFHSLSAVDFKEADCLIVMGTSLGVQPFAGLIECVPETVPRLLINLEKVGESSGEVKEIKKLMRAAKNETEKAQYRFQLQMMKMFGMSARGFDFDTDENTTDVFLQSTCDQGVQDVTKLICSKYLEELLSIQHKLEDLFPDSTVKPSAAVPPLAETTRDGAKGKIASEVKSSNSNSKDPKIEDKVDANSSAIKKSSNANTIQEKPKKTEGVKKRVKKRVKKKGKKPFERK